MQTWCLIYKNLRIYSRNYFLLLFCFWSNLEIKLYTSSNEETKVSQFSSIAQLCPTLWPHGLQHASLSITNSWNLCKLMSIESVMASNHLILYCPLLLLPSIFLSIRVFSNESVFHIRWPKYWSSASASVLPMNIQDWFPLGWTCWISLKSKGLSTVFSNTIVQKHQFFSAQLSL